MRHVLSLAIVIGLTLVPFAASADIAPPDSCGKVGEACTTAPPDYASPGICTKQRCGRATPNGPIEFDCNRCAPKPANKAKDKPKK
jgi:hypothetical protein